MIIESYIDVPLSGYQNMEIDQNNFLRLNQGNHSEDFCLIRIYEWLFPTISLGISQNSGILFNQHLKDENIGVVKRITGGRLVLHFQEITYSIIGSVEGFFGKNLHQSYEKISQILLDFLQKIGISAQSQKSHPSSNLQKKTVICYDSVGFGEITVNNKKLIGSAQKRGKWAFLQHGSIPFIKHDKKIEDYLQQHSTNKESHKKVVFIQDFCNLSINQGKAKLEETFLEFIKN